ncbi:hypothetical protein DPMN_038543 [Dreissena polymorpha]|uniref:Uncharacterized protein n=1 Tax=Dreissena polymorpha TaxID=45954 RepID=A0A9D4RQS7_DREPO|nr:hypothetical protein DPMN_038543 [Dreissena polymorpha]
MVLRWLPLLNGPGSEAGYIQGVYSGCPGCRLAPVRHWIHGAVHGPAHYQPVWVSPWQRAHICRQLTGR